jgi:hypothetical protein
MMKPNEGFSVPRSKEDAMRRKRPPLADRRQMGRF